MKKLLVLLLILAVAGGLFAQEAGTWSVSGWARGNFSLDFENEAIIGNENPTEVDAMDNTGAGATLKYVKGNWTVATELGVTTPDFGGVKDPYASVTATYASNGYNFITGYNLENGALSFAGYNWDTAANSWGFKGKITGSTPLSVAVDTTSYEVSGSVAGNGFLPTIGVNPPTVNYAGLFLQSSDKKILFETGGGADVYVDYTVWASPGPIANAEDNNPFIRTQFKLIDGLNFGFSWAEYNAFVPTTFDPVAATVTNPFPGVTFASQDVKPEKFFKNVQLGAKYSANGLTVAAGARFPEKAEFAYAGVSYVLLDSTVTISADGNGSNLGDFDDSGIANLAEKVAYASGPLSLSLALKENNLVSNVGGEAANNLQLVVLPYVHYDVLENARVKADINITKGLGSANDKEVAWWIRPAFYYNLNGGPVSDVDGLAAGIGIAYKYGVATDQAENETTTNALSIGFRVSF
jgi:hypothetical protein